jgi:glutamate 5-kinase
VEQIAIVKGPAIKESRLALQGGKTGGMPALSARGRVAAARRVVVKVGTNVVMRDDGSASVGVLYGIAESLANLRRAGREVLIVSSGAVGLGMQRLALAAKPTELVMIQACAAIGQSRLMSLYDDAFEKLGYRVAQVLLTEDDFRDPTRNENLRATLAKLLALGVIPIINENDTVSTAELDRPGPGARTHVFGDNDKLSALVMTHADADLLILLSDVDGLYNGDPQSEGATLIPELSGVTDAVRAFAQGGNGRGRGGMESKLEAARIANEAGQSAVIANGRTPGVLDMICAGKNVGSLFSPEKLA